MPHPPCHQGNAVYKYPRSKRVKGWPFWELKREKRQAKREGSRLVRPQEKKGEKSKGAFRLEKKRKESGFMVKGAGLQFVWKEGGGCFAFFLRGFSRE